MDIKELNLPGCYEIQAKRVEDARGYFLKFYVESLFEKVGIKTKLVELYLSQSKKNVIRGMHFQIPPREHGKMVCCLSGEIEDVLLDLRSSSATYGNYQVISLDSKSNKVLFIAPGIAHGFISKSEQAVVIYGVSSEYSEEHDHGIRWDSFGYDWGSISEPIISKRDEMLPKFNRAMKIFK